MSAKPSSIPVSEARAGDREQFDLFDLRLIVHIAEEQSLTRGAERCNISLPAASTRIRNLEDSIGTRLLHRTRQGATLTAAGEALLQHARVMLQQVRHMRQDLQEYASGAKGHIRIFATTTAISEFLPDILGEYLATRPDVSIDLQERMGFDVVDALKEGSADIGVFGDNVPTDGLHVVPFRRHRLVAVAARAHPLSGCSSIDFWQTLEYPYIGLSATTNYQSFLLHVAALSNKSLKTRLRVNNFESVCRMAELDIGIGLLPESCVQRFARTMAIRAIPLRDNWATRQLLICTASDRMLPAFAAKLFELLVMRSEHQTVT